MGMFGCVLSLHGIPTNTTFCRELTLHVELLSQKAQCKRNMKGLWVWTGCEHGEHRQRKYHTAELELILIIMPISFSFFILIQILWNFWMASTQLPPFSLPIFLPRGIWQKSPCSYRMHIQSQYSVVSWSISLKSITLLFQFNNQHKAISCLLGQGCSLPEYIFTIYIQCCVQRPLWRDDTSKSRTSSLLPRQIH